MSTWIADDAVIFGDVQIGEDCSIYYHTTIRVEYGQFKIGDRTNIQDNCVLHGGGDHCVTIGNDVTIGHSCIIHGCEIGDNTLIGMGSIIMNNAKIGNNVIIGAGSLITEGKVIPDNSVAYGSPAKVIRQMTEKEILGNKAAAQHYLQIEPLHEKKD